MQITVDLSISATKIKRPLCGRFIFVSEMFRGPNPTKGFEPQQKGGITPVATGDFAKAASVATGTSRIFILKVSVKLALNSNISNIGNGAEALDFHAIFMYGCVGT